MITKRLTYTSIQHKYIFLLITFYSVNLPVNAQNTCYCFPDLSCKDTGKPGHVCPDAMPAAVLGTHYDEIFTVIPPATYSIGEYFGTVSITKIVILEIEGLPEGITWNKNVDTFRVAEPAVHYCCRFEGTPRQCGEYRLRLKIKPYFLFFGREISPIIVTDKNLIFYVVEH